MVGSHGRQVNGVDAMAAPWLENAICFGGKWSVGQSLVPGWVAKVVARAESEEQTPDCVVLLPASPGFVPRHPCSAPGCLCSAADHILGFPEHGASKLVWPELPAPGELSGRGRGKNGFVW